MDPATSTTRMSPGLVLAATVVVLAAGLAAWIGVRRAQDRRLNEALAAWASSPLPAPGDPVDDGLADLGARLFRRRCSACHTIAGEPRVGPDLKDVTHRRSAAWIRSMILSPDSMTSRDPVARGLKEEYEVQMLTPRTFGHQHARALVEFLRRADGGAPALEGAGG